MTTGGQSDQRIWTFSFLNKEWPWIQSIFFKEQNTAAMVWSMQQSYKCPNLQFCKWGLFCPPGILIHSFCCSLVPWRILVILQDSLFPLREEVQGTCWWLCMWVGGCSCTEAVMRACWQGPCCCIRVSLNLVPYSHQKIPKQSQCFLLTLCTVTFPYMLHHAPSVLSRTWKTNNFQNQFVVNTEIFLSVLKGLHRDKVAEILSYLRELSVNSPSRQELLARASADKQKQRWHSKKKLFLLPHSLLQHYFRKSWMQILPECNCGFQEIT